MDWSEDACLLEVYLPVHATKVHSDRTSFIERTKGSHTRMPKLCRAEYMLIGRWTWTWTVGAGSDVLLDLELTANGLRSAAWWLAIVHIRIHAAQALSIMLIWMLLQDIFLHENGHASCLHFIAHRCKTAAQDPCSGNI